MRYVKIETRNGWMTDRNHLTKKVQCTYDFRNVKYRRYTPDFSYIPTYDPLVDYAIGTVVKFAVSTNRDIYICSRPTTAGLAPSTSSQYWFRIVSLANSKYFLYNHIDVSFHNKLAPTLVRDESIYRDYYTFSRDIASPTFTITNVEDISSLTILNSSERRTTD
jgi:hypothetical protein